MTTRDVLTAARAVEADLDRALSHAIFYNPAAVAWLEDDFDRRWDAAVESARGNVGPDFDETDVAWAARQAQDEGYSDEMASLKDDLRACHNGLCERCDPHRLTWG